MKMLVGRKYRGGNTQAWRRYSYRVTLALASAQQIMTGVTKQSRRGTAAVIYQQAVVGVWRRERQSSI